MFFIDRMFLSIKVEFMAKRSVIFLGSGPFSVEVFKVLHNSGQFEFLQLFSLPDRPVGRKQVLMPTPFKSEAVSLGYTVLTAADSLEILGQVKSKPDFLVVTDYGVILNDDVLALPEIESLNVHASLLPKYRGASPIQSALLNGEAETGVSVMKVVRKMDAGPVYSYGTLAVDSQDDYSSLLLKLGVLGGELLKDTLLNIPDLKPVIQDESLVTYCKKISKADGLIDFDTMTAHEVLCKLKAYSLFPKIFFEHNDRRFQIVDMSISSKSILSKLEIAENLLYVKTKNGVIAISVLKPESKNEMTIKQFLAGNPNFFV